MIEQTVILIAALASLVLIASNRIIPGCAIALIAVPFWLYATSPDQWGIRVAVCVNAGVYLAALILRLRSARLRRKFEAENEEYEHLSDAV